MVEGWSQAAATGGTHEADVARKMTDVLIIHVQKANNTTNNNNNI